MRHWASILAVEVVFYRRNYLKKLRFFWINLVLMTLVCLNSFAGVNPIKERERGSKVKIEDYICAIHLPAIIFYLGIKKFDTLFADTSSVFTRSLLMQLDKVPSYANPTSEPNKIILSQIASMFVIFSITY